MDLSAIMSLASAGGGSGDTSKGSGLSGLIAGQVGKPYAILGGLGNAYAQFRGYKTAVAGDKAYKGEMDDILRGHSADVEGLLAGDAYRNYLDTEQSQALLEQARGQLQEHAQQVRGGVASSGGTTESAVAAQTGMGKNYADIVNRMSAAGTQYNQQGRQALFQGRRGLADAKGVHATNLYSMSQNHAGRISQAGQNFSNAMVGYGESKAADVEGLLKLLGI